MIKKISIIVPVYNEYDNLFLLHKKFIQISSENNEFAWSYIFVNDGSSDDSLSALRNLALIDQKVKVIDLSRNFGKEIAMTAGVHEAVDPDAIICIDADLQHPPELIPVLIEKWKEGFDIVATIRKSIDNQPLLKRIGSHVFYWIMVKVSSLQIKSQTTATFQEKPTVSRPGVHSKTKTSKLKNSKNYKKAYRGQGR